MIRWAFIALVFLAAGCNVGPPSGRSVIDLESRNYGFIDEALRGEDGQPQDIEASLIWPDRPIGQDERLPAVVIMHSGVGQASQDWYYAKIFRKWGLAVFAVNTFKKRGIETTVFDHSLVSEATFMRDAFEALTYLAALPNIDPNRVALLGFSKSGAPAIFSALTRFQEPLSTEGFAFAAHVSFYPYCGLDMADMTTTGAPILVFTAENDTVTPARLCTDLASRILNAQPTALIEVKTFSGAMHAFDYPHPLLKLVESSPVRGPVPRNCLFREVEPTIFIETASGIQVTGDTFKQALDACTEMGARVGYNVEASKDSLRQIRALFDRTILENRSEVAKGAAE